MIELELDKLQSCLIWKLKVLASVRCMCVTHSIDAEWCVDQERDTAKLLRALRVVIKVKGDVLQLREKTG